MSNLNKAWKRWKEIIIITLVLKVVLLFISLIANPNTLNVLYLWVRWDSQQYIIIAKNGYQTIGEQAFTIVFYPLYPLLIKLISFLTNDFQISAVLISLFFSFATSIILFELTLLDFDRRVALLSVWFINIFPTAYFLQAAYTESLFLTTSLATIYFFRKGLFVRSGLIGGAASMTRVNGILLLPILFMEAKTFGKNLITMLLTPIGFLVYLLINKLTFGEPLYFSKILSSHWYKHFTWPWISIRNLISFYQTQTGNYYWLFLAELITIFLLIIVTIFVYLRVRKSYGIYMFFNLLMFSSTGFIMSTPRYALILFPIFIALGLIKNKLSVTLISISFLILLFLLTYLYTQGRWAF